MTKIYAFLPLALLALLVSCGVSSDNGRKTDLRPTPPAVRPEAQRPQPTEQPNHQSSVSPWYEHYDLGEVVVRIGPGAMALSDEPEARLAAIGSVPALPHPLYSERLQELRQVRERLLEENATLATGLAQQVQKPTPAELGTLRTQLSRLSAQQRLVMTKTQEVGVEHQALLAMLAPASARVDSRITQGNP